MKNAALLCSLLIPPFAAGTLTAAATSPALGVMLLMIVGGISATLLSQIGILVLIMIFFLGSLQGTEPTLFIA